MRLLLIFVFIIHLPRFLPFCRWLLRASLPLMLLGECTHTYKNQWLCFSFSFFSYFFSFLRFFFYFTIKIKKSVTYIYIYVQLPTVTSAITHAGTTAQSAQRDGIVNDANADAHTQCNEVNPTIYEELKLGQEGAGFKKLVP